MAKKKAKGPNRANQDRNGVEPTPGSPSPDDTAVEPDDGYIPAEPGRDAEDGPGDEVSDLFESPAIASFDDATVDSGEADPADAGDGVADSTAEAGDDQPDVEVEPDVEAEPDVEVEPVTEVEPDAELDVHGEDDDSNSILALFDHSDEEDFDQPGDDGEAEQDVSDEDDADALEDDSDDEPISKKPVTPTSAARPRVEKSSPSAPVKKQRPTRTRAQATAQDAPKRTGPGQFIGQIVQELKKVSWPTSAQLLRYFLIVLVFVVFMIFFITLLDLGFGRLMLLLFS